VGVVVDELSPTFSLSDIEAILRQFSASPSPNQVAPSSQHRVNPTTSILSSVTSGNSCWWFFDYGFCNHMSSKSCVFTSKNVLGKSYVVHTTDSSNLKASHIGSISNPNLSLHDAFLVHQLTFNVISVGQLCELGLKVHFLDDDCVA